MAAHRAERPAPVAPHAPARGPAPRGAGAEPGWARGVSADTGDAGLLGSSISHSPERLRPSSSPQPLHRVLRWGLRSWRFLVGCLHSRLPPPLARCMEGEPASAGGVRVRGRPLSGRPSGPCRSGKPRLLPCLLAGRRPAGHPWAPPNPSPAQERAWLSCSSAGAWTDLLGWG